MATGGGLRRVLLVLCALMLCQNGGIDGVLGGSVAENAGSGNFTDTLRCDLRCQDHPTTVVVRASSYYYYDEDQRTCLSVPADCLPSPGSTFTDPVDCMQACHEVGGCGSTKYGCCPDQQTPRSSESLCPGDEMSNGGQDSSPVRWDFIASGLLGAVLLLSLVTVAGIVSYTYRKKKRQRLRSRYIQEVLQVYNESSSSSAEDSDSSYAFTDNPESNNLFDQL